MPNINTPEPAALADARPLTVQECGAKLDEISYRLHRMKRLCNFITDVAAGGFPKCVDVNAEAIMETFLLLAEQCDLASRDIGPLQSSVRRGMKQ